MCNSLVDLGLLVGHKGHYTQCLQVSLSLFTGAYLVPYFILLILIGIPLFFLELAVGQRIRRGSIGVWNYVCPRLGGIGVSSLMVSEWCSSESSGLKHKTKKSCQLNVCSLLAWDHVASIWFMRKWGNQLCVKMAAFK